MNRFLGRGPVAGALTLTVVGLSVWAARLLPEGGWIWWVPPGLLGLAWIVEGTGALRGPRSGELHSAISSASLLMGASLLTVLVGGYGLTTPETTVRLGGAILGVLLVATGNVLPKQLPPLNTLRYDPAERQAVQRFAGWSLVIVGALFTAAWATLPLSVAGVTAIGIGVAGLVLIGWRTRRGGRVPPAHS